MPKKSTKILFLKATIPQYVSSFFVYEEQAWEAMLSELGSVEIMRFGFDVIDKDKKSMGKTQLLVNKRDAVQLFKPFHSDGLKKAISSIKWKNYDAIFVSGEVLLPIIEQALKENAKLPIIYLTHSTSGYFEKNTAIEGQKLTFGTVFSTLRRLPQIYRLFGVLDKAKAVFAMNKLDNDFLLKWGSRDQKVGILPLALNIKQKVAAKNSLKVGIYIDQWSDLINVDIKWFLARIWPFIEKEVRDVQLVFGIDNNIKDVVLPKLPAESVVIADESIFWKDLRVHVLPFNFPRGVLSPFISALYKVPSVGLTSVARSMPEDLSHLVVAETNAASFAYQVIKLLTQKEYFKETVTTAQKEYEAFVKSGPEKEIFRKLSTLRETNLGIDRSN